MDQLVRLAYNDIDIANVLCRCSAIKRSDNSYNFIHRSVYEFYVAKTYINEL